MYTEEKKHFTKDAISQYRPSIYFLTDANGNMVDVHDKAQEERKDFVQPTQQAQQPINYMPYVPSLEPFNSCPSDLRNMLYNSLTPRQRLILKSYCKTEYVKVIAQEMNVSNISYQRELKEIKNKLNIKSNRPNETRLILLLCFRFKISTHIIPKLLLYTKNVFGSQTEAYRILNEVYQGRLKDENAKA